MFVLAYLKYYKFNRYTKLLQDIRSLLCKTNKLNNNVYE